MRRHVLVLASCVVLLLGICVLSPAEVRMPGEYTGVVVFDRWDGCTLYSGVYLMYISERAKETLRPLAGEAVQIDATDVYQPTNPGDGLIREFDYLGPAPDDEDHLALDNLRLASAVAVSEDHKAVASIILENIGKEPIRIFSAKLAPTLLMKSPQPPDRWAASDGPSFALITRQSFESAGEVPRWNARGVSLGQPYAWTIGRENALPHSFVLEPQQSRTIDITFELPDGEYDFLCGYGGGVHWSRCFAANLSAFDVKDGKARLAPIENR